MSATHRRAARRELEAARLLGTKRVHRSRYQRAPDVDRVQARYSRRWVSTEVKTRAKLPGWLLGWLAQAASYGLPGDVPVVVVSATGGPALVVLRADDFAALAGLGPEAGDEGDPVLPFAGALAPRLVTDRRDCDQPGYPDPTTR